MTTLENTVALITGAQRGIGAATVAALREAGAHVIATDLTAPTGGDENYVQDVTDEAAWAALAADISQKHGRLDILVNNAGIALIASIEDETLESWRKLQAVNVDSLLLSHKAMLPLLRKGGEAREGGASIINLSSVGGLIGFPFTASYCASKGAVKLFTKAVACEFGMLRYNIRVNSIHPGGIDTSMLQTIARRNVEYGVATDEASARTDIEAQHPLGRWGRPEEIASGIVYLASPAASFMTGSELVIDGGFTAR
ncbi:SDR family oxidoreductase (plasmid) [Sphingobium sp. SJ10-10]|uniref:SDR family NAD(P)-dependent oxidoreductase n=1 Tax=Sphingobium sp. SJ10-10 TaxID=3114999 RepID=UPI002E19A81A|nr:SDR family oxidoreductase [Sphingobium sp. SJ10-10]